MGRNAKIKALKKVLREEINKMPFDSSAETKELLYNKALKNALKSLGSKVSKPTR